MKSLYLFSIAISLCIFRECFGKIPSSVHKCRVADLECIPKTINDILRNNPNGNEELGLGKLEPVHLDELVVAKQQPNKALNLNFKFIDVDIYGMSKTNFTRVVGFERDPVKSKFILHMTVPLLSFRGKYEANGKVLLLPLTGKGNAEIDLKNFRTAIQVKVNATNDNGKIGLKITNLKIINDPELLTVRLDNLFNGNKALGDELNNVINTNWRDIWSEMESGINEGYKDIVHFLMSDVFKKTTYDEFYSDYFD